MSEPLVPAACYDPLLAEAVLLLSKEVLKLKTEKTHLKECSSAEVIEEDSAGELQPQRLVAGLKAGKGLDQFSGKAVENLCGPPQVNKIINL